MARSEGRGMDSALWSALPVATLLVGHDDVVAAANPAAESLFNLSSRALCGRALWDVICLDTDVGAAWHRALQGAAALSITDAELSPPSAARFRANLHCAPYEAGILVQIAPLDPRRVPTGAPIQKVARSAIGMAEMLAHEIKNPLAGITGAAQLLAMSLSAQNRELTDLIVGECRRITALLAQVEQFGNMQPPAARAINIHDTLERARRSAGLGFAAHMQICEQYDPSLPDAFADPDHLLQVVLNLIKNAAEAAPEGGAVTLRSFYDTGLVRDGAPLPLHIEIADDGPGLPPDIADQVFDPFVSGHENGTGLGLALVSKLMRDNGGAVSVQSAPGRTVFRLSLPRAPKE